MAKLFKGMGVEVGVAKGEYSEIILQEGQITTLYGVDPYTPHRGYQDYTRETTFANLFEAATERLKDYPNYHFIPEYSMAAVKRFKPGELDFVYIDADHSYKAALEDITEWAKKVRRGGIVAGDDYERNSSNDHYEVTRALFDYAEIAEISKIFIYSYRRPYNWMFYKP